MLTFAEVADDMGEADGQAVTDPEALARIRGLGIPPAWKDVWICPIPTGHLQAVGTDAAGRRQYQRSKARENQHEDQPFHCFRHRLTRLGGLYHRDHTSELSVLFYGNAHHPHGATRAGNGLFDSLPLLPGSLGHICVGEAEGKGRLVQISVGRTIRQKYDHGHVVISGSLHDTVVVFAAQHAVGFVFRLLQEQVILLFACPQIEGEHHNNAEDQQDEGQYAYVAHRQAPPDVIEHQRGPGCGSKV